MEHVNAEANHTLDNLGIAKNAREEKIRARDEKMKQEAENARMAKLYREHILGEKPREGGMVSLGAIRRPRTTPPRPSTGIGKKATSSPATKQAPSLGSLETRRPCALRTAFVL